jgi:sec-independent protein translocase protein TatC
MVEERESGTIEPDLGDPGVGEDDRYTGEERPPDDEEMPLTEHVEEMLLRFALVLVVAGTLTVVAFPFADEPIMVIWNAVLPDSAVSQPRVYGPLELKLTELKLATLAGVLGGIPVFVYETYRFMRPGLYPHERRYYLAAVPTSLVLAVVGMAFSYFLVLPAVFAYFFRYSDRAADIAFALQDTFSLIIVLSGYLAVVFQIPLLVMLAVMMDLTSRRWLEQKRLYFWGGFLGASFLFTFDPTGVAPFMVTLTMIGLFEGTLALLRWTGN